MNTGKTLFAQLMDFLPWTTFARYVARYEGDKGVRTLSCAEQFRVMAFAQLTYRESLRDIEVCLSAQAAKLYHMGFREPIRRSTLADANESRDWRIHADFAQRLIGQARALYASEDMGLELSNTVYALDSTTIDLCLCAAVTGTDFSSELTLSDKPSDDMIAFAEKVIAYTDALNHERFVASLDFHAPESP